MPPKSTSTTGRPSVGNSPKISSEDAIKSINNIRNDLERLRNEHQQLDSSEVRRREQMRKDRDDRIQNMRSRAAADLTDPRPSSSSSSAASGKNSPSFVTRRRLFFFLTFIAVVAYTVALAASYLGRTSFIVSDTVCTIRRRLLANTFAHTRDIPRLDLAAEDTYQGEGAVVHSAQHNRTFFWGTYRPNVLAGVKSRESEPLLFGIAWWDGKRLVPVRHTAEDGDAVFFRWDAHDGRWYGREVIEDRQLGMKLNVRFAKAPTRDGWVLSVQSDRSVQFPLVFALYFASEYKNAQLTVRSRFAIPSSVAPVGLQEGAFSLDSKLVVHGYLQTKETRFVATVEDELGANQEAQWQVFATRTASQEQREGDDQGDTAWNIDFTNGLRGKSRLAEHYFVGRTKFPKTSSLVFVKKVTNNFRFTVTLAEQATIDEHLVFQDPCSNEAVFQHLEKRFDERFEQVFQMTSHYKRLAAAGHPAAAAASLVPLRTFRVMMQSALSNLLGGMGYWHGDYLVQTKAADPRRGILQPTIERRGPRSLFSGVPSRAKFPRGFLWDEGFHQLLVHHWDRTLSEDVLLHWLVGVMEPNGWIPREQILGNEARTRVPGEFVPQHPEHTNPPAMILVIQGMVLDNVRGGSGSAGEGNEAESVELKQQQQQQQKQPLDSSSYFASKALPQLQKWFKFLVESQCGGASAKCSQIVTSDEMKKKSVAELESDNTTFLFRWRSRNGYHLLASGLDDYPRPHCKITHELHVDLFSWVHMVSRSMKMLRKQVVSSSSSLSAAAASFSSALLSDDSNNNNLPHLAVSDESWTKWLINIHWDKERQQFSDVTGCGEPTANNNNKNNQKYFSQFFGYVNLFPLLTLSLEEAHRDQILATIRKAKTELSSGKGLQSLSNATRRFLEKHDDYWTGPIWININFLFLRALKRKYNSMIGPEAAAVYDEVRNDVLANVGRVFGETGKLWENYDFKTGDGRGTAPFTGWTALVILIAAEKY